MKISEAESTVLSVLWNMGPCAADDVIRDIAEQQGWKSATVKTLLNRLLSKGAIEAKRDGRRYIYSAVMTRDEFVHEKSVSLIDKFFGGRVAPLVSHLSEQETLTPADLAELKQLIERIEDGE